MASQKAFETDSYRYYRSMKTTCHGSNKYFILFIDDFLRMTCSDFMKEKFQMFSIFKKFKSLVEKQSDCYIKKLKSDRGKKYTSNAFQEFSKDEGLKRQLTIGYIP